MMAHPVEETRGLWEACIDPRILEASTMGLSTQEDAYSAEANSSGPVDHRTTSNIGTTYELTPYNASQERQPMLEYEAAMHGISAQQQSQYHSPHAYASPSPFQSVLGQRNTALATPPSSTRSCRRPLDPEAAAFTPPPKPSLDYRRALLINHAANAGSIQALRIETPSRAHQLNVHGLATPTSIDSSQRSFQLQRQDKMLGPDLYSPYTDHRPPIQQQPLLALPQNEPAPDCFQGNMQNWVQETYHPQDQYTTTGSFTLPGRPRKVKDRSVKSAARSSQAHSGTGTFTCPGEPSRPCKKRFNSKTALTHHQRIHKPPTKICSICGKVFHFENHLKRHMKTHTKERHLLCNVMGCPYQSKGFPRQDQLNRHVRAKHPESMDLSHLQ